jgi:hypothetical protein
MFVRITDGVITETRSDLSKVPEHKREWYKELPDRPEHDSRFTKISNAPIIVDDEPVWEIEIMAVSDAKRMFTEMIDNAAEAERLKYITMGAGQALEYQRVAEEARRFWLDNTTNDFPMLQASVDAGEANDLAEAAELVSSKDAAWQSIGAEIRRIRLAAKIALDEAETVEAVAAAYDNIVWP